jgi:hypothetical protein
MVYLLNVNKTTMRQLIGINDRDILGSKAILESRNEKPLLIN